MKKFMCIKNLSHQLIVPIGYTFSWCFALIAGGIFNERFSKASTPTDDFATLLFYTIIPAYIAFIFETVFIFIDCGSKYKDERFNGKVFYIMAVLLAYIFATICIIGLLIIEINPTWVYILAGLIVLFKFGISILSNSIEIILSDIQIRTVKSNNIL